MDKLGISKAFEEAQKGYQGGGIPIGAALLCLDEDRTLILGSGHNQRIQKSSATLHGEISALENAGRLKPEIYKRSTMYTTLSPCSMCSGAILLYKIPRVVIGENINFKGEEELLRSRGVEVIVLNDEGCRKLMKQFIDERPEQWNEDIGECGKAII
ncbi:cytosine deaminase [Mycena floridula]|nr:cytosine deaminase [Mycena floridula]